jgi:hypothetical protein
MWAFASSARLEVTGLHITDSALPNSAVETGFSPISTPLARLWPALDNSPVSVIKDGTSPATADVNWLASVALDVDPHFQCVYMPTPYQPAAAGFAPEGGAALLDTAVFLEVEFSRPVGVRYEIQKFRCGNLANLRSGGYNAYGFSLAIRRPSTDWTVRRVGVWLPSDEVLGTSASAPYFTLNAQMSACDSGGYILPGSSSALTGLASFLTGAVGSGSPLYATSTVSEH